MNKNLTEIAYILDRSGSMNRLKKSAVTGFNTFIKEQKEAAGDVTFSLVLFDHECQMHADRAPLIEVSPLDQSTYVPRGSTALLDAIGSTIQNIGEKLAETPEDERPGKVIIAIYTDGYENSSTDYSAKAISKMIHHQTDNYGWEILFLAANEDAMATAAAYGIQRKNASHVSNDSKGMSSSHSSFSRKVRGSRATTRGCATLQEQQDSFGDLSTIVQEEVAKRKK